MSHFIDDYFLPSSVDFLALKSVQFCSYRKGDIYFLQTAKVRTILIVHEMWTIVSHLRRDNIVHFRKWTFFCWELVDFRTFLLFERLSVQGIFSSLISPQLNSWIYL